MQGCFYTRVLLHRGTFHTGLLFAQTFAHTDAFAKSNSCIQNLYEQVFLHRNA